MPTFECHVTRRGVLFALAAACLPRTPAFSRESQFWNKKPPSEWTPDEIDQLLTKSPWARPFIASTAAAGNYSGPGPSSPPAGSGPAGRTGPAGGLGIPGIGGGRIGGLGIPGIGGGRTGGRRGEPGSHARTRVEGVVRWESAKPVLEAVRTPLPEDFANHYVISVSGIPAYFGASAHSGPDDQSPSPGPAADYERIKELTYLEPGKSSAQPGVVQESTSATGATRTLLFGFSKDLLTLTPEAREAAFVTQMGELKIKVKFALDEMTYRGAFTA